MTVASAPERDTARSNGQRWLMLLAVLLALGVGAAITAAIVTRDDAPTNESLSAQLSQVQASCGDWITSSLANSRADARWCTDMFAWMSDQSGGSMMGSMMWQGPEQLGRACHEWVSQDRADAGALGRQRCIDMVEWMDGHMSSQGGNWMMPGR